MREHVIQPRDLEILRTLARLRYVRSRDLKLAFFASDDAARQRLRVLARLDLIRLHTRGLPSGSTYHAWRLSSRGVDVVGRQLREPVPDGLAELLVQGSLAHLDHREELTRVYVELVRGASDPPDERLVAIRAWARRLASRAAQFLLIPDGDVELRYRLGGKVERVVPDATLVSERRQVRAFLELDRSNKTLGRLRETLTRYWHFCQAPYAAAFPDGFAPAVVFVVHSAARARSVSSLCREVLGKGLGWASLEIGQTTDWLERTLLVDSRPSEQADETSPHACVSPSAGPVVLPVLKRSYGWLTRLFRRMRELGLADQLAHRDPDLMRDGDRCMAELYEVLHSRPTKEADDA
jgi:hypothetical protein